MSKQTTTRVWVRSERPGGYVSVYVEGIAAIWLRCRGTRWCDLARKGGVA